MNFKGPIILLTFLISAMISLGHGCATLYRHCNYKGFSKTYCNSDIPWIGGAYNDEYSSFKLGGQTRLTLFEHSNFTGRNKAFYNGNVNCLVHNWNDITSSIKVHKK